MRFENFEIIFDDFQMLKTAITILPFSEFPLRTKEGIHEIKQALIEAHKIDTSFKLLTRLESFLRLDIDRALQHRNRDPISKLYRNAVRKIFQPQSGKSYREQARFLSVDDVLNDFRTFFLSKNDTFQANCSKIINYFKFRHWYAHGRYFLKPLNIPDPNEMFDLGLVFHEKIIQRGRRSFSKV